MTQQTRRDILRLLAAGAAASVAACSKPDEIIYPAVNQPEGVQPGEVQRYATALPFAGYLRGVTGLVVDGRPVKLEGLAAHPASQGATDLFTEVSILDLYDPQRLRAPGGPMGPASWQAAAKAIWERVAPRRGQGTVLLTGRVTSPTLLARIAALKAVHPGLRHVRWEPFDDDAVLAGSEMAFGRRLTPRPRLQDADVVLCLGADPLGPGPDQVANARAWSERRRAGGKPPKLYVIEPSLTATGAVADWRGAVDTKGIAHGCRALAALLKMTARTERAPAFEQVEPIYRDLGDSLFGVITTLIGARDKALIVAGERQPAAIHALTAWANAQLGARVNYFEAVDPDPTPHRAGVAALLGDMQAGRVDTLIVLDANPAYAVPGFADAMKHVPLTVAASVMPGETTDAAKWSLPLAHPLESWHDGRATDGTASIAQPLVRPFYDTRSAVELVDLLADPASGVPAVDRVRAQWASLGEAGWRRALVTGVVPGTAAKPVAAGAAKLALPPESDASALTVEVRPSPALWDGRFAGNAWAQECPDPLTKEVWGAAARMHADDMAAHDLKDGDLIHLGDQHWPAVAAPGQAKGVVTLIAGYGRRASGAVADGVGANAFLHGASFGKVGARGEVLTTQHQFKLEGELAKLFPVLAPGERTRRAPDRASLLPNGPTKNTPAQWAMAIDTDVCIGCNACVVACQAENNVPAIGPAEIAVGRDMHWLRIDFYEGDDGDPLGFQPVPCMQCEKAPCEPVCPVEASIHDAQGLNVQVYNRCIGTRTCEANCPYKVRRFNFLDYANRSLWGDAGDASVSAQRNPDVTVRGRGVMEKCTYCVQRIERATRASDAGQDAGPVVTACQASCPTSAITFGTLDGAAITAARADPRHYALLEELGTRPRTTYLAKRSDRLPDIKRGRM